MFDWNILSFLWLIVAGACLGFGWAVGSWVKAKLFG